MKQANFDIDLVRAFVAVSETRSFTKAAEVLHRTQSAVSMKIKRLEDQIGLKLLERDTTTVSLTSAGERALTISYELIRVHEDALRSLSEAARTRRVMVATSETYALSLLPGALASISRAIPDIEMEIQCGHSWRMLDSMERDAADLVVATYYPKRSDGELLARDRLLWVCAKDFEMAADEPVPLALFPEGCVYRRSALAALQRARRPMRIAFSSPHHEGLMAAVASGVAATVMIESAIPASMRILTPAEGFPELPPVDIMLYQRSTMSGDDLVRDVANAIRTHFDQRRSFTNARRFCPSLEAPCSIPAPSLSLAEVFSCASCANTWPMAQCNPQNSL
nr:LysR family transcriptional regulator [Sphingobium sp.]